LKWGILFPTADGDLCGPSRSGIGDSCGSDGTTAWATTPECGPPAVAPVSRGNSL
jgi:hypothetical protein